MAAAACGDFVRNRFADGSGVAGGLRLFALELFLGLADVLRAVGASLEESRRDLREQGVGEAVFVGPVGAVEFVSFLNEVVPFGFKEVSGALGDGLFAGLLLGLLDEVFIPLTWGFAVVSEEEVGEFSREHFVAAHQHVEHGLSADDL